MNFTLPLFQAQFTTNSQRRLKRRKLYECDGTSPKNNRRKKSKHRKSSSKNCKYSTSKSLRPQRLAARNALNFFSRINGASVDEEDDQSSESDLSKSDSTSNKSNESDRALQKVLREHPREIEASLTETDTLVKPPILPESRINTGNRRLVLKLHLRESNRVAPSDNRKPELSELGDGIGLSDKAPLEVTFLNQTRASSQGPDPPHVETDDALLSQSCGGTKIRWKRASKCFSLGDATDACPVSNKHLDGHNLKEQIAIGNLKLGDEHGMVALNSEKGTHGGKPVRTSAYAYNKSAPNSNILDKGKDKELDPGYTHKSLGVDEISIEAQGENRTSPETWHVGKGYEDRPGTSECQVYTEPQGKAAMLTDNKSVSDYIYESNTDRIQEVKERTQPIIKKLKIISKRIMKEPQGPSSKINPVTSVEDLTSSRCDLMPKSSTQMQHGIISGVPEEDDSICRSGPGHRNLNGWLEKKERQVYRCLKSSDGQDSMMLHSDSNGNMYNSVSKRSNSCGVAMNAEVDIFGMEESNLDIYHCNTNQTMNFPVATTDGVHRTRSMGMKAMTYDENTVIHNFKMRKGHGPAETSRSAEKFTLNEHEQLLCEEWQPSSKVTAGSRSMRHRREIYHYTEPNHIEKRNTHHSVRKPSWLMLPQHEESYRYIPQQGDEVAYLIQVLFINYYYKKIWGYHLYLGYKCRISVNVLEICILQDQVHL